VSKIIFAICLIEKLKTFDPKEIFRPVVASTQFSPYNPSTKKIAAKYKGKFEGACHQQPLAAPVD